jgi:prevent-host-death family protein
MATAQKSRKKARVEIGADEARQKLGDLIDRAGFQGERFVFTRHGKQLVALVSIDDLNTLESREVA